MSNYFCSSCRASQKTVQRNGTCMFSGFLLICIGRFTKLQARQKKSLVNGFWIFSKKLLKMN